MTSNRFITKFITKPCHYDANNHDASRLRAIPAAITLPDGEQEPGVVVLVDYRVKLAMNHTQALALANGIADVLEANTSSPAQTAK